MMEPFTDEEAMEVLREIHKLALSVLGREITGVDPARLLALGYIAGMAGRAIDGRFSV